MKSLPVPKTVNLHIGGVYASGHPVAIRTVLGSCIAACLYDPVARVGGMNHFMLPHAVMNDLQPPARYGPQAMELLIRRIVSVGGARHRLRAKVFGGANVLSSCDPSSNVAERNAEFARDYLERHGIPVSSYRVGGTQALEVIFYPQTARALVRPVRRFAEADLAARELSLLSKIEKRAVALAAKAGLRTDSTPGGAGE